MSEYYDALSSAVANLKPVADQPARYAFYDRARRLVLQRLQSVDPPMADADIRTEMTAFNAAIRQLENDIARPRKPVPPSKQAPQPTTVAAPVSRPAPPPPPPVAPPAVAATPPRAGSLDIPPEFVGEASPEDEATAEAESPPEAASVPAPEELETSPAAPFVRPDNSVRKLAIVVGAAVMVGVLVAGAYAFWGRSGKAPVRTATTAPSANVPSSSASSPRPAVREPERPTADGDNMPYILRRQLVYYRTTQPPGTWIISKSQNFLYVVRPNSTAMRYTVGMGPDCSEASGLYQISRKEEPSEGRLLYLGDTKFRIKQANTPITIGRMAPSPGFQLVADDFTDLYDHGDVGTRVVVAN